MENDKIEDSKEKKANALVVAILKWYKKADSIGEIETK